MTTRVDLSKTPSSTASARTDGVHSEGRAPSTRAGAARLARDAERSGTNRRRTDDAARARTDRPPGSKVDCDPPDFTPTFSLGPFQADYYFENDGNDAGRGTDGTNPSIVPVLVASETVARPAINYVHSDLYGIDSYGFHGVWDGIIDVHAPSVVIDANFDMSFADAHARPSAAQPRSNPRPEVG